MEKSRSSKSANTAIRKKPTGIKPHNFYWDKKRCTAEAKKYRIISHFKTKSFSAYRSAKNNGWLFEVCAHMISPQKPKGYWTRKRCAEVAKQSVTLIEFRKTGGAYLKALKEGWIDSLGLKRAIHKRGHWTRKSILKLIRSCKTQNEFITKHNDAYQAATKRKIWPSLKNLLKATKIYWSREKTIQEARKFLTRESFRINAPGAYGYARKNGFFDEACAHMLNQKSSFGECAIEEFLTSSGITLKKEMKFKGLPIRYAFDFYLPDFNILIEHHGAQHEKPSRGKTLIEKKAVLANIQNRDKLKANFAKNRKIPLIVIWQKEYLNSDNLESILKERLCAIIPQLKLKKTVLSNEELSRIWVNKTSMDDCQLEAKKYQNRKAFKAGSHYFYIFSRKNNWLNDICGHMKRPPTHNFKWSRNACEKAAKLCKSKVEFEKRFSGAYAAARKNQWYEELCKHMVRPPSRTKK